MSRFATFGVIPILAFRFGRQWRYQKLIRKEKAAEAASAGLKSPVALSPSIDIPGPVSVRLANAALHRPARWAAVPCPATAVGIVITVMVPAVPVSSRRNRAGCRDGADDAQCRSDFSYCSHRCFLLLFWGITRSRA